MNDIINEILNKYEKMSLEELEEHINQTLNTDFGKFLKVVNDESLEALEELEKSGEI